MSKFDIDIKEFSVLYHTLIDVMGGVPEKGRVAFWTEVAKKLNDVTSERWSWRYPHQVYGGLKPSEQFYNGVKRLMAMEDGAARGAVVYTERVVVYARERAVHENAIIIGKSILCERKGCKVRFVPNTPNRIYCSPECASMARKQRKSKL